MSLPTGPAIGVPRYLEDQLVIRATSDLIRPVARRFPAAPRQDIHQLHERVQRCQRKIARLVEAGRMTKARREAKTLFCAPFAVLVAASRAIKEQKWRPGQVKPNPSQVASFMFEKSDSDPVSVSAKAKRNGGHRAVFSFGLVDRARQHLVKIAYEPLIRYADQQFGVPGASRQKAIALARQLIASGKFKFAAQLDISNCFGSVDLDRVRDAYGIPQWVLDEIVTTKGKEERRQIKPINKRTRRNWDTITQQRGYVLPQGSLVSPMLAYGCMREKLERFRARFETRVVVIMYCDNLLLLAPGRESLQAAENYLIDLFTAENFTLRNLSGAKRIADGIEFLGFKLQRRANRPYIGIVSERQRAFRSNLRDRICEIDRPSGRIICAQAIKFDALVGWIKGSVGSMGPAPDALLVAIETVFKFTKRYRNNTAIQRLFEWLGRKVPTVEELTSNTCTANTPRLGRWVEPWKRGPIRNPDIQSLREQAALFCHRLLRGELSWLTAIRVEAT